MSHTGLIARDSGLACPHSVSVAPTEAVMKLNKELIQAVDTTWSMF